MCNYKGSTLEIYKTHVCYIATKTVQYDAGDHFLVQNHKN